MNCTRRSPCVVTVAPITTAATDNVVAAAQTQPPQKRWNKNPKWKQSQDANGDGSMACKRHPPQEEEKLAWTPACDFTT